MDGLHEFASWIETRQSIVELWLHRVADDLSGLKFQEWDPSAGTDDTSVRYDTRQLERVARHGLPRSRCE
jgi:hypothetical protein